MKKPGSPPTFQKFRNSLLLYGSILIGSTMAAQAQTSAQDAVRQALETNPDVQVRYHDFRSAGHATDAARGDFRPQVGVNAAYGRQRDNFITGNPMNTGFAEIGLTQLLWDGGRTSANVEEFNNAQLVRYFELLDTAEDTAREAMRAYLDVLRFRELVRLAEENLQTHQEVYDQIAESARAGVARTADLEQINGRLALAEANLVNEESNLHDVTARYLRIVGDLPPQELSDVTLDPDLPDGIQDVLMQAYQHSPRYHAALRNISAAGSATRAQEAERMPRLNLTANYGVRTRDEFGTRESHTDGRIGLELTFDLYTGGRNTANIRRAVAQESSAMSLRDRACVDIRQDVQIAFNDLQQVARRIPVLNQHRLSSDRVRTAYRQQFDIGQRTLLDVLDSENEFFEASRAWTNANFDETLAAARTLAAMGLLLETLNVRRGDIPTLDELGAEPMEVDPATACPLPNGDRMMALTRASRPEPRAAEPMVATQVTLSDRTTFDLDSDELLPAARETLSELVAAIREGRLVGQIEVVGHTCDLGPAEYNQDLSERRAQAVVDYLLSAGIEADEIVSDGRGENEPRFPNDSEANRSRNRRVEINFVTEQASTGQIPVSPESPITELREAEVSGGTPSISAALDEAAPRQSTLAASQVLAKSSSAPQPVRSAAYVQVATFSVEANAERLAQQLRDLEHDAVVIKTENQSQPVWLVRVRTAQGQEAAALRQELREQTGLDGMIVTRPA